MLRASLLTRRKDRIRRGRLVARVLSGAWRSGPPSPDLSPDELSEIAPILHRQGSSGLAWARIRGTSLVEAPGADLLRDGYRYHTLRVRLLERQLAGLAALFQQKGVDPILGKGWAMGRLYPEPGRRPYGDLDFLVLPSQMDAARGALSLQEGTPAPVELHAAFNELEDRAPEDLHARSELHTLEGVPIRVFAPEDHLRLLALHGLEHGLCRPLWMVDLALFLESLPRGFDWALCMEGDEWLSQGVGCALGLARDLLGADLEKAGVPTRWRDQDLPLWMVEAALEAFGAEIHYMDELDPDSLLLKPRALVRVARLRWANPIEVTFRRRAPWNDKGRLPYRLADYLVRGWGFLRRAPMRLLESRFQ